MGRFKQKSIDNMNDVMGHVDNIRGLLKEAREILTMISHKDYLEFHEGPQDLYDADEYYQTLSKGKKADFILSQKLGKPDAEWEDERQESEDRREEEDV